MTKRYSTALLSLLALTSAYAQDAPTIITQPAKGDTIDLYRTTTGLYAAYGGSAHDSNTGDWQRIVFGEDGAVYLENPINTFYTKAWIKGKLSSDGTTIEFQLPQAIYGEEDIFSGEMKYGYASCMHLEKTDDKATYVVNGDDSQMLRYKWADNTLTMLGDEGSMLGLTFDGGKWNGYGETSCTSKRMDNNTVAPPSTATVHDGLMLYMNTGEQSQMGTVKYAVDGDAVYLGGLSDNVRDYWIKGELKDNVATFPSTSYVGIDKKTVTYVYASSAVMGKGVDDFGDEIDKGCISDEPLTFAYDPTQQTLESKGILMIHKSADDDRPSYIFDVYRYPLISPWEKKPGTPLPPIFTSFMPYEEWYGVGGVQFKISYYSTEGNYLDKDCLYYNFYIDGELQTFTADEYRDLTSDLVDIPYSLEGYDFEKLSENERRLYFYKDVKEKVGMEAVYFDGNTRLGSGVTEYYPYGNGGEDGIDSNIVNEKRMERVEYTDVAGRRISRPGKGLYVRTITYSDGSKVSKKVVK